MRLKCIKLAGFKSFVDPTTVNFPSNLCAVVGPNGCGKSNVIDAVRWVMGESSAKNLRGESMADVIFNGSGGRKPIGQASVELVFDNHDRTLAGEYANFSEVSIKRKVDRDAQSSYSLNGTKCRRRDITDIFLGTGLGARSYSIIEQGMISRLIESKPEELRSFIEEAAGISKYKERRKETESRIKRTKSNLERLADIREELGRQLQHLQRQSVAAEKYAEFKQQERHTSADLNALRWRALDDELRQNQEVINSLEIKIESTIAEQREIDANVEQRLTDNSEFTDALGEVQARFYSLANDIARIEQSIEHHIERMDQLRVDLVETEADWEGAREELDVDLQKVTALDALLKSLEPDLSKATATEAEFSKALEKAEFDMQDWQQRWDEFNELAEEPRQTAEVEQARIQQLEDIVERGINRKKNLEQEKTAIKESPEDDGSTVLSKNIIEIEQSISALKEENTALNKAVDKNRSGLQSCTKKLDAVRSELQTSKGRHASLEALQQAALGQDDSNLNKWLDSKGLGNRPRLGEGLTIEPGWEKAVETVLGDTLQSICVSGIDNLDSLLTELPDGLISFVDTVATGVTPGSKNLSSLAEKVQSDGNLGDLLHGVSAAEDLTNALTARPKLEASESIITRQGIWLGPNWIRVCNTEKELNGALERKGAISELVTRISGMEDESNNVVIEEGRLRGELVASESRREALQDEISEYTGQHGEIKSQLSANLAKVEEGARRRKRISHELLELVNQLDAEKENTASARARLQNALDSMEENIGGRDGLEKERDARREELRKCRIKAIESKELAHKLALRKQSVQAQLVSTRETMDRMASQVQRSKERITILNQQIEQSDAPLKQMRSDLENLLGKRLEVERELGEAKARVDENEYAIRKLEQDRNQVQQRLGEVRDILMQKRLKSEGSSVKRDGLLEQLQEAKFKLEEVLKNLPEDIEEEACERELEKLGNRIQRLGLINLAAIDEYNQQSERKVYLDKQNEDLEKALNTLENAIRKIDKETRTRFKETFDKVNAGLQDLFPKVFGGGHAYLDMTGEDLLNTGVAIMARPPGKRNSTIHLLSGGEKAMTAIALVFSIFRLSPSPFCMLDEVDAPLDDANAARYVNLVRDMSETVQFIFITHNKITMEMANQLLGVTMQEAGVSRIVAVDIDEAAELAAM
jgi:chromosome segregation protein